MVRFLASYWWVLAFLLIVPLAIWQWTRMPLSRVVLLLRLAGALLLLTGLVWAVTGNVQSEAVSIQLTAGQAATGIIGGIVAIIGAQCLARKRGPSA
jgi:hypothetical protein